MLGPLGRVSSYPKGTWMPKLWVLHMGLCWPITPHWMLQGLYSYFCCGFCFSSTFCPCCDISESPQHCSDTQCIGPAQDQVWGAGETWEHQQPSGWRFLPGCKVWIHGWIWDFQRWKLFENDSAWWTNGGFMSKNILSQPEFIEGSVAPG